MMMTQRTAVLPSRSVRTFMWDLADEGLEEVIAHLQGLGADGLNVALAGFEGRYYCPHNPKRALVHAPEGVVYFQPLLSCYETLRPRPHPEYGSGAFAAGVRDTAHEYGMQFTATVSLFNNPGLAQWHPECTVINALGDRLQGSLCPAHRDVQVYAQALVEDLASRVGVDAVEIQDFTYPSIEDWAGPDWRGVAIGPGLGYLLSLCFCPQCRQQMEEANLEADDIARQVERMIRAGLSGDLSERRLQDEIADSFSLTRLAHVRAEVITGLLDELSGAILGSAAALQPILTEHPDRAWQWGLNLADLRQRVDRVTLRLGQSAAVTAAQVERYLDLLHMTDDTAAEISLSTLHPEDEIGPGSALEACQAAGIERFVFSHYGLVPLDMLDFIATVRTGTKV